jgi:Tol biopolymer transport system component
VVERLVALLVSAMVLPAAVAEAGTTERASVDSDEDQADLFAAPPGVTIGSFHPSISSDGQIVAFDSNATDLVAGDTNGVFDVFVRDRGAGTTQRVSVSNGGAQANDFSGAADVSGNGRFVAFESGATNLVAGDTNGVNDIFVRDRLAGTTERVSVESGGQQLNGSIEPAISGDGRFVVFTSFPAGAPQQILVRDRQLGTTEVASVPPPGYALSDAFSPAISGDGRFVAFPAFLPGNVDSVLVLRDRLAGTSEALGLNRGPAALSADGRVIAFTTGAGTASFVMVLDRAAGTTEPIGPGQIVVLSSDGRFVAFTEVADVDVSGPGPGDVIVHDLATGTEEPASVSSSGEPGNDSSGPADLSADGRFVAFISTASNLVPNDSNGAQDIFVRDRAPSVTDLLTALQGRIRSFGLPKGIQDSFLAKVKADCDSIGALVNQARAQAGKALSEAQAAQLIADGRQIRAALGCPSG